jgi:hypothetical protein
MTDTMIPQNTDISSWDTLYCGQLHFITDDGRRLRKLGVWCCSSPEDSLTPEIPKLWYCNCQKQIFLIISYFVLQRQMGPLCGLLKAEYGA